MNVWRNFKGDNWKEDINVEDFIINNYHEYKGSEKFLEIKTEKTNKVWEKCLKLLEQEREKGVLDIETKKVSGITNFEPGYVDLENEVIVGLQTDKPLKRMINPFGGIRMVYKSLEAYHYTLDEEIAKHFSSYRKTHNECDFVLIQKKLENVGVLDY